METDTALVRSDSAVELNTEAAVNANVALIVNPGYAEHDLTLRFNKTVNDACLQPFRVLFHYRFDGVKNFLNCLMEFRLIGIAC